MDPSGRRTPVGKDNLVLRECILKNTDFVEGIVVYAGHESKAMMNNGGPRHKISKVRKFWGPGYELDRIYGTGINLNVHVKR